MVVSRAMASSSAAVETMLKSAYEIAREERIRQNKAVLGG